MKTLLLHYWLVNHRGGEKVLDIFHELFPEADILTHVYDPAAFGRRFPERLIKPTFINSLPLASRFYRHYLPLMPAALQMMDVTEYDFLLSSESGPVKGVRKLPDAFHVCYCHTPMRYLWDAYDDYRRHAGLISRPQCRSPGTICAPTTSSRRSGSIFLSPIPNLSPGVYSGFTDVRRLLSIRP